MRKIDPRDCLEFPQRRLIYEQIRDRPGRTLSDLLRATGLTSATVLWHTQKLVHADLVVTENHHGLRLYHAISNGLPGKRLGRAIALLGDRRNRAILGLIESGLEVDDICRALDVAADRVAAVLQATHMKQAQTDYGLQWGLAAALPLTTTT